MRILQVILLAIVVLLGLGSGIAKVMLLPDEVAFFGKTGLTELGIQILGTIQMIAALMLPFRKACLLGGFILGITFLISTALIFTSGKVFFGMFSILPIALLVLILRHKK
jgi:hypothetical protein